MSLVLPQTKGNSDMQPREIEPHCPDCGASIGEQHNDWCDVERCPDCGFHALSCSCEGDFIHERLKWDGYWPGIKECQEFCWYSKMVPGRGWVQCDKDDPEAREDLNRLYEDAEWDAEQGRFVLNTCSNSNSHCG